MKKKAKAEVGADMRTAYEWLRTSCEIERKDNDCKSCPLMMPDGECATCRGGFQPADWPELKQ